MTPGAEAPRDLLAVLGRCLEREPEGRVAWIVERRGVEPRPVTMGDLARGAAGFAAAYRRAGVREGDRVVLALPTSPEFLHAFWACHLLGAIPAPAYPPIPGPRMEAGIDRLAGIFRRARPAAFVTIPILADLAKSAGVALPPLVSDGDPDAEIGGFLAAAPRPRPEDCALIQFTSGSTSEPKGCVISHRAVLENVRALIRSFEEEGEEDVRQVHWIPLYHDMGLMGGVYLVLGAVAAGKRGHTVLQAPEEFIVDPLGWLEGLSRHRAHYSAAPNFALSLVERRLRGKALALDLSPLRGIVTGAEPVDPSVVRAFEAALAPYGLRPGVVCPAWGLAENTVFGTVSRGLSVDRVDRAALEREGEARPSDARDAAELPSLGTPYPGAEVRVVSEKGEPVPERVVGEVELRSASLMDGYFEDPDATAAAFRDGWLRTGDLGYLSGGALRLVGRSKDLIIAGGRNIAPQDLERAAAEAPGVRAGCVVAFGYPSGTGTEYVAVLAEAREGGEALIAEIRRLCHVRAGVVPQTVRLVPPGWVPKTSSGKLQRRLARDLFLRGDLGGEPA